TFSRDWSSDVCSSDLAKRNLSPAHIYLHRSRFLQPIESVTAPPPLLRRFHQSTSYRIAMHVPQLLHPLRHSPYIEIIEARLPERSEERRVGKERRCTS